MNSCFMCGTVHKLGQTVFLCQLPRMTVSARLCALLSHGDFMDNEIECRSCGQKIAYCNSCGGALSIEGPVAVDFRRSLFEIAVRHSEEIPDSLWEIPLSVANISQTEIDSEVRKLRLAYGLSEIATTQIDFEMGDRERVFEAWKGVAIIQEGLFDLRKTLLCLYSDENCLPSASVDAIGKTAIKQIEDLSYEISEACLKFEKRSAGLL